MDALLILGGIIGTGVYLDNKKKNNVDINSMDSDVNDVKVLPQHNNIYDTNNYNMSKQIEEITAIDMIDSMRNDKKNIIDSTQTYNNVHRNVNLDIGDIKYSEILQDISKDDFMKNDQGISTVPYFKGNSAPTINFDNNYGFQASIGGATATTEWRNKKEVENLGDWKMPQNIHGRQWGEGIDSDFNRYIPGTMRKGELPFDQIKVQHIDEKSFDNRLIDEAIANTKNIDNLRSSNNQKATYKGRVISGNEINSRGLEGIVNKNKKEKMFKLGEDRNLITTGAVTGSTKRPRQIIPDTNRQYLNQMQLGPATSLNGTEKHMNRSNISKSMKTPLDPDNSRNIKGNIKIIDHDRLGYRTYPNEREVTQERTYHSNIKGEYEGRTIGLQDTLRKTIKETNLDPVNGFIKGVNQKTQLYNMDKPKRTIKETTLDSVNGFLKGSTTNALKVRPLDELKPTIKQGTMYDKKGIAGSYINEKVSRENYLNSETNANKEIISAGINRSPTLSSTKIVNGVDTVNVNIKKIGTDYMTQYNTGIDKIYDNYKPYSISELTTDKNNYKDAELLLNQIDPELLNPFKNNPYTKPLNSYNY